MWDNAAHDDRSYSHVYSTAFLCTAQAACQRMSRLPSHIYFQLTGYTVRPEHDYHISRSNVWIHVRDSKPERKEEKKHLPSVRGPTRTLLRWLRGVDSLCSVSRESSPWRRCGGMDSTGWGPCVHPTISSDIGPRSPVRHLRRSPSRNCDSGPWHVVLVWPWPHWCSLW